MRDVRVVVEEARAAHPPVADAPEDAAVVGAQRPEQELAERPRASSQSSRSSRRAASESAARARPFQDGDRLVVAKRLRPLRADGEEPRLRLRVELAADDRAAVLERLEQRRVEAEPLPFGRRPGVREPLDAVGVGVLRRREAAAGDAHLAQEVVDRLLDDVAVPLLAGHDPARGGTPRRAARCRRASSRSAGRASARRPSTGGSPRRRRRRARLPPSRRASAAPCRAPPAPPRRSRSSIADDGRELRRRAEAAERGLVVAREVAAPPRRAAPARAPRRPPSSRAAPPSASTSFAACASRSSRRSRHASATACRSWRKLGIPWRGSGGKYVPA